MKLRIKGNSIRLRLSQSEVNQVQETGAVQDQIVFGSAVLAYELKGTGKELGAVEYENKSIAVVVPKKELINWAKTAQVGISFEHDNATNERLQVLIEKDFKCLTERKGEDESDLFANPLDAHNC